MSQPDEHPIALRFEVTENPGGFSVGQAFTITAVERDEHGVRVRYEIVPALAPSAHGPWGQAKDDRGNQYDDVGGAFGPTRDGETTDGVLTMPLPAPEAATLRVRFTWDQSVSDIWKTPAHEVLVALVCA